MEPHLVNVAVPREFGIRKHPRIRAPRVELALAAVCGTVVARVFAAPYVFERRNPFEEYMFPLASPLARLPPLRKFGCVGVRELVVEGESRIHAVPAAYGGSVVGSAVGVVVVNLEYQM